MSDDANHEMWLELRELIDQLCDSQLSPEQCRRLEELVCKSEACSDYYVFAMQCHAGLARKAASPPGVAGLRPQPIDASAPSPNNDHAAPFGKSRINGAMFAARPSEPSESSLDSSQSPSRPASNGPPEGIQAHSTFGFPWASVSSDVVSQRLLILVVLGAFGLVLGMGVYTHRMAGELRIARLKQSSIDGFTGENRSTGPITKDPVRRVATLVNVTNCRWDTTLTKADLTAGELRPGQSLHLLEGVAKINSTMASGSVAAFQLEGPLAMLLTDEGMPSLVYGKLSGTFSCNHDYFTLDTPLGRVVVSGDASIGIKAAANDVELHVFNGAAMLEMWSTGLNGIPNQRLTAKSGTSLSARVTADNNISVDYGTAHENRFVTPTSVAASQLLISDQYVATIRDAQPIAYWRFEEEVDGLVRNEISDRFHCRIVGDAVRLRADQGSRTAEFGITAGPGYLVSDDVLDEVLGDSYTLEAWVKPTYYHHGALFSLIQWSPLESPIDRHRLHLELCGPNSVQYGPSRPSENHPGRIRFIHQAAECYSASPYVVRKWQHLAAVKDHAVMRLYADGQLVATSEDRAPLGDGLRVLMGQLFPRNPYVRDEVTSRLFVGELDEVALYGRPLSESDLVMHYRLARPDVEPMPAGSFDSH